MITGRKAISAALIIISLAVCNCGGGGGDAGSSSSESNGVLDLAWDANVDSDISGYKIYYGTSSGKYDRHVEVTDPGAGDTVTYRLTNLTRGQTYFLAVTAHNSNGNESGYSNEVSGTAE